MIPLASLAGGMQTQHPPKNPFVSHHLPRSPALTLPPADLHPSFLHSLGRNLPIAYHGKFFCEYPVAFAPRVAEYICITFIVPFVISHLFLPYVF